MKLKFSSKNYTKLNKQKTNQFKIAHLIDDGLKIINKTR